MLTVMWLVYTCLLAVHALQFVRNEDDICEQHEPAQGICKRISQCPKALEDLKNGKIPKTCSFLGTEAVVCCQSNSSPDPEAVTKPSLSSEPQANKKPQEVSEVQESQKPQESIMPSINKPQPVLGSKSQEIPKLQESPKPQKIQKSKTKCGEYANAVYIKVEDLLGGGDLKVDTCQTAEQLIVGGSTAQPREFPHMALIGSGGQNNIMWFCGGTLISERFVLSAAHCSHGGGRGPAKWVRLGDYDIALPQDEDDGSASSREYEIAEIIRHPEYKRPSVYNDIALYKLVTDVEFSEFIRPICLQTEHQIDNPSATHTGWEPMESDGERRQNILQRSSLVIKGEKECNDSYKDYIGANLRNGIMGSSMLCTVNRHGRDSCEEFQTGGPLQIKLENPYCMYSQVGINSFGMQCPENSPAVYTRVSHFVPWIESIVWP